jgi:hypothetical protein
LAFWICHLYMTCSHETKQPVHWSRGSLEFGDIAYTSSVLSYTASQSLGCIMTYHDYILLPTQVLHFRSFCSLNFNKLVVCILASHTLCIHQHVQHFIYWYIYIYIVDYTAYIIYTCTPVHWGSSFQAGMEQTNKQPRSRHLARSVR